MRSLRIVLIGLTLVLAACGGSADPVSEGPAATETQDQDGSPSPDSPDSPDGTVTPSDGQTAAAGPCDEYEPESQVTDEAVLLVDRPAPDDDFPPGSTVEGCTNAFEASFQWELLGADGQVVASGNEMASCGSGCLGTFAFTVDHDVDAAQDGTLRLFVESAEDGSVQMETETPVRLAP